MDGVFNEFESIIRRLRRDCPWDRRQTHESIRHHMLEETYEAIEAIDQADWQGLKGELGDLALHVVLQSIIAEERGEFSLDDVFRYSCEKLVRRHPHVFGETKVESAEEVKHNWEKIKLKEGRTSVLEGIPKELPALLRAYRMQERAAKVGFDWEKREDVWAKVAEETDELHREIEAGQQDRVEDEFGDLLFSLVNYARFVKVNPELALRKTIEKFTRRFLYIEQRIAEQGKDITTVGLQELDTLWNEAKGSPGIE